MLGSIRKVCIFVHNLNAMKDFSDIFYSVKQGDMSAKKAAKMITKSKKLWPKDGEYKYLYSNYPDCAHILSAIWV